MARANGDYSRYGLSTLEDVVAGLVLDERGARDFAGNGFVNTDHNNRLAAESPRLKPRDSLVAGRAIKTFASYDLPGSYHSRELHSGYLARRLLIAYGVEYAARFVEEIDDEAQRAIAEGWIDYMSQRPASARRRFERAWELDPDSTEVRGGLLLLARARILTGRDPDTLAQLGELGADEAAVVAGWRAQARNDITSVRALDAALGSIDSRHPLYPESARLRTSWRLAELDEREGGDRESGREALEIINTITTAQPTIPDRLLRASAALAAGYPLGAVSSIEEMLPRITNRMQATRALAVLDAVPAGVADDSLNVLKRRLRGLSR